MIAANVAINYRAPCIMPPLKALVISTDLRYRNETIDIFSRTFPGWICREYCGGAALSFIKSQPWDIIVAPLDMQEITGFQLIDALAEQPQATRARLLLSHSDNPHVADAVRDYAWFKDVGVLLSSGSPQAFDITSLINLPLSLIQPGAYSNHSLASNCSELSTDRCLEQVVAYFQPQHRVIDGALCGAEALARWQHPTHGILNPPYFLERFHSPSLRSALWKQMLDQTIYALHQLNNSNLSVALNVTPDVANTIAWAEDIAQGVAQANLKPHQLGIEVTEQTCELQEPALAGVIGHLRLRGFPCAIDDFGTGTSSLQRLARIPFSQLKIDQSCIRQARTSLLARKILQYTVSLAQDLGLSIVAEGIETEEDFERIAQLGCNIAQGFYFARPMPLNQFLAYAA